MSRYSDLVSDWTAEESGFGSLQGQHIFLFYMTSRPALGPTQLPVQWVTVAVYPGIKRQGREADHLSPSSVEVKNGEVILPLFLTF
jgi:hypothetical protein